MSIVSPSFLLIYFDKQHLIGYEAGPTGYGLCRGLQKKGYDCVIMAPTTIKKSSSDKRRKTDRRDAKMLAMALATDTYRRVYVLDDEDEGTREFTRACNSLQRELKQAKQMLLSFLLRIGRSKGARMLRMGNDDRKHRLRQIEARGRT